MLSQLLTAAARIPLMLAASKTVPYLTYLLAGDGKTASSAGRPVSFELDFAFPSHLLEPGFLLSREHTLHILREGLCGSNLHARLADADVPVLIIDDLFSEELLGYITSHAESQPPRSDRWPFEPGPQWRSGSAAGDANTEYVGSQGRLPSVYAPAFALCVGAHFDKIFGHDILADDSVHGNYGLVHLPTVPAEDDGNKAAPATLRPANVAPHTDYRLRPANVAPHTDSFVDGEFASVHYLGSPAFHGTTGTVFFSSRATGRSKISSALEDWLDSARAGLSGIYDGGLDRDFDSPYDNATSTHGGEEPTPPWFAEGDGNSMYKRIHAVGSKWNRAIIYPSNVLHAPSIPRRLAAQLSSDPAAGRLTANLFFGPKESEQLYGDMGNEQHDQAAADSLGWFLGSLQRRVEDLVRHEDPRSGLADLRARAAAEFGNLATLPPSAWLSGSQRARICLEFATALKMASGVAGADGDERRNLLDTSINEELQDLHSLAVKYARPGADKAFALLRAAASSEVSAREDLLDKVWQELRQNGFSSATSERTTSTTCAAEDNSMSPCAPRRVDPGAAFAQVKLFDALGQLEYHVKAHLNDGERAAALANVADDVLQEIAGAVEQLRGTCGGRSGSCKKSRRLLEMELALRLEGSLE